MKRGMDDRNEDRGGGDGGWVGCWAGCLSPREAGLKE